MSKLIPKLKQNPFLATGIFIVFNVILNFIFYLFNIRFRMWVINGIILFSLSGLVIGIIKSIHNKTWLEKINIISTLVCFLIFIVLLILFLPFVSILAILKIQIEHSVTINDQKYVAVVHSFLHVDVDYYKYYGPFLMGTKVKIHGDFGKGGYDPYMSDKDTFDAYYTYYDDFGKIINEEKVYLKKDGKGNLITADKVSLKDDNKTSNESDYYLLPEEAEVLYEKSFDNTILRFVKVDNALGQKILVNVVRSRDNGKNFYYITDNSIQVNNNARYEFLTKDIGFIANDKIYLDGHINGLKVTTDGGKTFQNTNFNYKNTDVEFITIEDLPYYENNALNIKCSVYKRKKDTTGYEDKELIFESKDKGLNWYLKSDNH